MSDDTKQAAGSAPDNGDHGVSAAQAPTSNNQQTELRKLRDEAAGYRIERNSLREQLAEMTERMAKVDAVVAGALSKTMEAHMRAALARAGVVEPDLVEIILPGLAAKANAAGISLGEDFQPKGDLSTVVASVAEKFAKQGGTPTANPAAQSASRQLPSPHTQSSDGSPARSAREQIARALAAARQKP